MTPPPLPSKHLPTPHLSAPLSHILPTPPHTFIIHSLMATLLECSQFSAPQMSCFFSPIQWCLLPDLMHVLCLFFLFFLFSKLWVSKKACEVRYRRGGAGGGHPAAPSAEESSENAVVLRALPLEVIYVLFTRHQIPFKTLWKHPWTGRGVGRRGRVDAMRD